MLPLRRADRPSTLSVVVLSVATIVACSSTESDDGSGTAGGTGSRGQGDELAHWQRREGNASIVGASDAVPVSNRSFSGFRDGDLGETYVACTYTPASFDNDGSELRVVVGVSGRPSHQARWTLRGVYPGPFEHEFVAEEEDELELPEFAFTSFLTHDEAEGGYVYGFGIDEFSTPPKSSNCRVDVTEFDQETLVGSVSCTDLFSLESSPDHPITNVPRASAEITLAFDCPLFVVGDDEPGGNTGSGGRSGSGGSSGSGGGNDGAGGGTSVPSCRGVATPCSLLSASTCSSALGCSPDGDCGGIASSCYYQFDASSCYSQDGCYWSSGDCGGVAWGCSSYLSDLACVLQEGCSWTDSCGGVAYSCSTFASASSCLQQPGCIWD